MPHDADSMSVAAPRSQDLSALAMKAQVGAALFGDEAAPLRVGRYEILETLGIGGMGVVYAAWDESLGRRVALKLLPSEQVGSERERARLAREAQALAKLSHPNVVHVYEVGEHEHGVFVAMELVEGVSLQKWQQQAARSRAELVEVYLQAGRGLAAAHRAGLVHRDFKPANVLVGDDGRVRVVDFGLAQGPGLSAGTTSSAGRRLAAPPSSPVTRTGALAGTPAYMAPEQLTGGEADARADQFSFCVALYEALVGCRPYEVTALRMAFARSLPPPAKGPRRLPLLLARALRRGLALEPPRRFADMDALLRAIEAHATWRRRAWALTGPVVLGLGVAWLAAPPFVAVGPASAAPVCEAPEHGPAAAWNAHKQAIEAAFTTTGKPFAADVWRLVERRLDEHAHRWSEAYVQACREGGEAGASPVVSACLDRHAVRFEAVLGELERVDGETILNAGPVVDALVPAAECLEAKTGATSTQSPTVPVEVLEALERARVSAAAGRVAEADAELRTLLSTKPRLDDAPLLAEILVLHGEVLTQLEQHESAWKALTRAQALAGVDARGVRAVLAQVHLATELERDESAEDLSRQVEAMLEQLGRPPELRADHLDALGEQRVVQDPKAAVRLHQQALVERAKTSQSDDDRAVLGTKLLLANALASSGDGATARSTYEEILATRRRTLGEQHPEYANVLFDLGYLAYEAGQQAEAEPWLQRALAIEEAAFGREATRTARTEVVLALVRFEQGDHAGGLALARHAWDVQRSKLPSGHSDRIAALRALATMELALDHHERALELHRLLAEETGPATTPEVLHNIAWLQCQVGQCVAARPFVDRAHQQIEATLLGAHSDDEVMLRLYILHTSALVALAEGNAELARVLLAEVLRDAPALEGTEALLEEATANLARARRARTSLSPRAAP